MLHKNKQLNQSISWTCLHLVAQESNSPINLKNPFSLPGSRVGNLDHLWNALYKQNGRNTIPKEKCSVPSEQSKQPADGFVLLQM